MDCPCFSKIAYENCCESFLTGKEHPETAEKLMRARYTAYATQSLDFITDTHHPKTVEDHDIETAKAWSEKSEWLGLEIKSTEGGQKSDKKGSVEFIAKFKQDGEIRNHHEVAEFLKEKDKWYFLDGKSLQVPFKRDIKIGRNDPCTCGSGKKYKKCCGK